MLSLPHVDAACRHVFLTAFRETVGAARVALVLTGSGAHQAKAVRWPPTVVPIWLPPYSPELNPVGQVFRSLPARFANRIVGGFGEFEAALTAALQTFWEQPPLLQRLVGYPWCLHAASSITPDTSSFSMRRPTRRRPAMKPKKENETPS